MKSALVIGAVVLLLAGLVGVLLFILNLSRFRGESRAFIEDALNRKVTFDGIRLMALPRIGLRVTGVTVMDDPAFSAGPFASLASVELGVKLKPLLSKRLAGRAPLTRLVMTRDRITLPIIISGTTRSPAYTLDMKAVDAKDGEQVKQTVAELLKGQQSLEELLQKAQEALEQFFGP
jgi:hypothetical protein